MKTKAVCVQVAQSKEDVDSGYTFDSRSFDTIKEATAFAKYSLTQDYQKSAECSEQMGYACICVLLADSNSWKLLREITR